MTRKLLSGLVFVAAATGLGLYLSRGPWIAYRQQQRKADLATKEMLKSQEQKEELLQQQAKLYSPMGQEELARAQGYRKAGEQPLDSSQ